MIQQHQPVAILNNHHVRQVNALAFHPIHHGLLLSASQDCTVIVWEQRKRTTNTTTIPNTNQYGYNNINNNSNSNVSDYNFKTNQQPSQYGLKGLFGALGGPTQQAKPPHQGQPSSSSSSSLLQQHQQQQYYFTWHCRTTFTPKNEAIRDVQWSPIFSDGTFTYFRV